jgi:putative ABC transport system ATP-binding protein
MIVSGIQVGLDIAGHTIFSGVDISCPTGQLTALVGPSGSGKTTLLHCLGMLQRPSQGKILIDGVDATGWSERQRRVFWQRSAAFVLQDYGVIEDESVEFNVTMKPKLFGRSRSAESSTSRQTLEQVGLGGRGAEQASHLSGGEKQRLAIARAVYKNADVIFVDEPTASLDGDNRTLVIDLLLARAVAGANVIIATHDDEMIAACHQVHRVGALQPTEG